MAIIRRGYSDDFVLKNGNAGIGSADPQTSLDVAGVVKGQDLKAVGVSSLSGYEGFLNSDQQIDESISINSGASLSGEIIVGTGQTVTVTGVGLGTTTVGVGTFGTEYSGGTITNTIDTTEVNSASQGAIESLKVYNTFNPPLGGTNDRPYAAKPGQLYYNQDFKTIEFWDGNNWRQVDYTTRSGRVAFAGGAAFPPGTTQYATIDFVNIQSLGNTSHFGELLTADSRVGGCASSTRGLFAGGFSPANNDDIDYITIASEGNGIDFGNLTQARQTIAGCSSSTRGVWNGGRNPGAVVTIDYNEIATLGNALDFGDLTANKREWPQAVSSPTRGVIASGEFLTNLDTIIMSSKGNAVEYGDLTKARGAVGALGNSVRGVFAGGNPIVPTIDYITTASGGNATDFGNLTVARMAPFAGASATRGVFGQGYAYPLNSTAMDYITIASTGDAQDFGDASFRRIFSQGSASDSHGGLGGF